MNLLLLRPEDLLAGGRAAVDDRRLQHAREVLRAREGDALCVGLEGGKIGRGIVVALTPTRMELEVAFTEDPPPPLDLVLAVALPRPPTLRKVLQQATAMGVKRLVFFRAERVEGSYFTSHALRPAAIAEDLRLGLEQARDTALPAVEVHPEPFHRFVREAWPGLREGRQALIAHPGGGGPFPCGPLGPCALAVGPEGGFVPAEVLRLEEGGGARIDLGPRILRVETAVVALLARLSPG